MTTPPSATTSDIQNETQPCPGAEAQEYYPPVEALLPHSHPMILVDRLASRDGDCITSELEIRPDSPLVFDGQVPALVAIEYMAQTIGLLTGFESYRKDAPVQVGYLLGTRDMTMKVDHFQVGDKLTVQAKRLFGEDEIGAFQCTVFQKGEPVVTATLNVYKDKAHVLPGRI